MATGDGKRLARPGVKWVLSKVRRNYQWFFQDGRWNYEGVKTTRRVADGEIAVAEAAGAKIAAPVEWGNYRLDVTSDGNEAAETSVSFSVGYESDKTADTPDVLDVALDKAAYADGESLQLRLSPRFAGKATLAVVTDKGPPELWEVRQQLPQRVVLVLLPGAEPPLVGGSPVGHEQRPGRVVVAGEEPLQAGRDVPRPG